jgi:hypothetical protein
VAHAWLRYRAAKRAVDTAQSNDQAKEIYQLLESFSLTMRLLPLLDPARGTERDEEDEA